MNFSLRRAAPRRKTRCAATASLFVTGLAVASVALTATPAPAGADPAPGAIPGSDRVYELVSPANPGVSLPAPEELGAFASGALGFVRSEPLSFMLEAHAHADPRLELRPSRPPWIAPDGGNLASQLAAPLIVQANGSAVFFEGQATPPGTGAIPDGGAIDSFRSARTPTGWRTTDLLPSGPPDPSLEAAGPQGAFYGSFLLGASADGASALIFTPNSSFDPAAFADPSNPRSSYGVIYRVFADGAPPQLLTRASEPLPKLAGPGEYSGPFEALSASPDLSTVAFRSSIALATGDTCNLLDPGFGSFDDRANLNLEMSLVTTYLSRSAGLAALPALESLPPSCNPPSLGSIPAILPDGRPILYPGPYHVDRNHPYVEDFAPFGFNLLPGGGTPLGPQAYTVGPLVLNGSDNTSPTAFTPLTGPSGATYLADSPDGQTAYVRSTDPLDANYPGASGQQLYAVDTTQGTGWDGSSPVPAASTPGVTCLTCDTGPDATYAGLSKDGSHLFFASASGALWEYEFSTSQPLQLLAHAGAAAHVQVISQNGRHLVASTAAGLTEYGDAQPPISIEACGTAVGVSDDGERVVCDATSEGLGVINEWVSGQIAQISPQGSPRSFTVQSVGGPQLQDVFFLSQQALLPDDENFGLTDVYDARIDGGFPAPRPQCSGDACQGAPSSQPPSASPSGTATFSGPENETPTHKGCTKGQVKRHGKCVVKHPKKPNPKRAGHNGGGHK